VITRLAWSSQKIINKKRKIDDVLGNRISVDYRVFQHVIKLNGSGEEKPSLLCAEINFTIFFNLLNISLWLKNHVDIPWEICAQKTYPPCRRFPCPYVDKL
jgi:hypothetical protein